METTLEEYEYCKTVIKKHFNKNLIKTEKEEQNFWSSTTCWICEKLTGDEKVKDHCNIKVRYNGAAHWKRNFNLKLTKKVPV